MTDVDIVVVGAGLSGLRTAHILQIKEQKSVIVLEARDRVGGRTCGVRSSYDSGNEGANYDIGGQWIGPGQERMYEIVKELNLATVAQYEEGKHISEIGNSIKVWSGDLPRCYSPVALINLQLLLNKIDSLAATVPLQRPWDTENAAKFDSMTLDTFLSEYCCDKDAILIFDHVVHATLGMDASQVSALWFLWFVIRAGGIKKLTDTQNGAQQDKIVGGSFQVAQKLAELLGDKVRLLSPVVRIEQDENKCTVYTPGFQVTCKYVVLAVPPSLCSRIEFDPPMPAKRDSLCQAYPMGHVIKTLMFYDKPWWREKGYSGMIVSDGDSLRLAFDACQGDTYALCGFFLGDSALNWSAKSREDRRKAAAIFYRRMLNNADEALKPTNYKEHDWCADPWSRGAYMGVAAPGVLTNCGTALLEPIGRVHFAGTETAAQWSGYMEGALESAERVANEIRLRLDDLPPSECPPYQRPKKADLLASQWSGTSKVLFGGFILAAAVVVFSTRHHAVFDFLKKQNN